MQQWILAALGIALVDMVLSGDNALVIGATASRLPRAQRLLAICWGGLAAIVFRLLLTIGATELLRLPYLQAIGGVLLLFIAVRLLFPEQEQQSRRPSERLFPAIVTILVADATMSLDNVIAIAALARQNMLLLVAGLLVSMVLLFAASALIARVMEALAWLIDLAAVVLAVTAANLIAADAVLAPGFSAHPDWARWLQIGCVAFVVLVDVGHRLLVARKARRFPGKDSAEPLAAEHEEARTRKG